jgi:hypothetical protein
MKRQGIAVLLRIVVVASALALALVSQPQGAWAGWTWDEMTAAVTSTDGGSPESSPADACPGDDGWTWDESADPSGDPGTDGWTWDEECATGPGPAPSGQPAP